MMSLNTRRYPTAIASLALAVGWATADAAEHPGAGAPEMEVVAVVEKFEPAPINKHDYFLQAAESVDSALTEDLDRMLSAAVMTTYQVLSEKFQSSGKMRVAAAGNTGAIDGPVTGASALSTAVTSRRAAP